MSHVFSCTGMVGVGVELRHTSSGQAVLNVIGFGDK